MTMPFYVPPEQLVKDRADFARKGINRGRPIVVSKINSGILLVGENASPSLRKIGEIYDRIGFAGVGRFNEFETMRVAGIRYADLKGFSYARSDVTGKGLANAYSQTMGQIFSHEIKPYEVEIVVAEVGADVSQDHLFRIQFDGTLRDAEGLIVMGAQEDEIAALLDERLEVGMALNDALSVACSSIEEASGRDIDSGSWEAAFLDRDLLGRTFRRLSASEVATARS